MRNAKIPVIVPGMPTVMHAIIVGIVLASQATQEIPMEQHVLRVSNLIIIEKNAMKVQLLDIIFKFLHLSLRILAA